jgi:mono/diheme cytochrome c family protein
MTRCLVAFALLAGIAWSGACSRRAPEGSVGGSIDAGRQAFVRLGCYNCHDVSGGGVPAPTVVPAVQLGGRTLVPPSKSKLESDIELPSSHFAVGYPQSQIMTGDRSKMPDYSKVLTKQQVADLVAFLDSRYKLGLPSPTR